MSECEIYEIYNQLEMQNYIIAFLAILCLILYACLEIRRAINSCYERPKNKNKKTGE